MVLTPKLKYTLEYSIILSKVLPDKAAKWLYKEKSLT